MYVEIEQHINDDGTEIEMSEDKMSMLLRELPSPCLALCHFASPSLGHCMLPAPRPELVSMLAWGGLPDPKGPVGIRAEKPRRGCFFTVFPLGASLASRRDFLVLIGLFSASQLGTCSRAKRTRRQRPWTRMERRLRRAR